MPSENGEQDKNQKIAAYHSMVRPIPPHAEHQPNKHEYPKHQT